MTSPSEGVGRNILSSSSRLSMRASAVITQLESGSANGCRSCSASGVVCMAQWANPTGPSAHALIPSGPRCAIDAAMRPTSPSETTRPSKAICPATAATISIGIITGSTEYYRSEATVKEALWMGGYAPSAQTATILSLRQDSLPDNYWPQVEKSQALRE